MRLRSTGLGKTELVGEVEDLKRSGDFLIMVVNTTSPVKWKVRAALSHKDMFSLLRMMLKWSILRYLLRIKDKPNAEIPAF